MLAGFRAALGAPSVAMAATFLGFGAAVAAAGLGLGWALAAGAVVYGMPGQLILLGGVAGGAPWPAVASAIAANARFLPMAVAIAPWLGARRWIALPFIAVTPWAGSMRVLPALPAPERLPWFMGFALGCWGTALCACAAGYALAPMLPGWLLALLVFANPIYFGLLLAMDRATGRRAGQPLGAAAAGRMGVAGGGVAGRHAGLSVAPMTDANLALLALILACQALRAAGLWLAGGLRADHPFIRWAGSVAVATLAAFIVLAVVAPAGVLATIPWPARVLGAVTALGVLLAPGERVLAALLSGLGVTGMIWWMLVSSAGGQG